MSEGPIIQHGTLKLTTTSGVKVATLALRWSKEGRLQQLWIDPYYQYEYNQEWRDVPTEQDE